MILRWLSLCLLLGSMHGAFASNTLPDQIDHAFEVILATPTGKSICRDIFGADEEALHIHLGISKSAARKIAKTCIDVEPAKWIYPTSPSDIRKLTAQVNWPRYYKWQEADASFPIESWTDSFTNVTTIMVGHEPMSFGRLVQILVHEMAVYLDSKAHPLHPGAQAIPHLRTRPSSHSEQIDPLVALTNPLQAHTLTYLRALQVEFAVLEQLQSQIDMPPDYHDPYLRYLISEACAQACIEQLIVDAHQVYRSFALPLLAFAPHYRSVVMQELSRLRPPWTAEQWQHAKSTLIERPVQFRKNEFTGDVVADLARFFYKEPDAEINDFLSSHLWPAEWVAISQSRFPTGQPLLEFMKQPLLSGYNIALTSGPRVRIRTGGTE